MRYSGFFGAKSKPYRPEGIIRKKSILFFLFRLKFRFFSQKLCFTGLWAIKDLITVKKLGNNLMLLYL
jgi:hypothetical protein